MGKRTPEAEETLQRLLELGLGFESAAPCIGWTPEGLRKWRRDDEEFETRCQAAIARGKERVVGKLMEKIESGNLPAIFFWLSRRTDEFREKVTLDNSDVATNQWAAAMALANRLTTPPVPASDNGNGSVNGNGHGHH